MLKNETKADRPGKILIILRTLLVGGTEKQAFLLGCGLRERGWTVHFFSLDGEGGFREILLSASFALTDGGFRDRGSRIIRFLKLAACQLKLSVVMLRNNYDVVQTFLPLPNFMGALASALTPRTLLVTSKRNLGGHQDRRPGLRWVDRTANRLSDAITVNAAAIVEDSVSREQAPPTKMHVIYNGFKFPAPGTSRTSRADLRSALHIPTDGLALCFVASLTERKSHDVLIEAFSSVAAVHSNVVLFLIGEDRGMLPTLKNIVKSRNLNDRVFFLGQRNDIDQVLGAMDIGIISSYEEGLSNALVEKLAAGLPVIATDVGGNPEVLRGMPGCILVPPNNSQVLAAEICNVLSNMTAARASHHLREELVRTRYSTETMIDAYESLYRSLSIKR